MSSKDFQSQDGSRTIIRRVVERGVRPLIDGQTSTTTSQILSTMTQQHQNEQKELQELNNKFAVYLDRVHYLEDFNKKLTHQLDNLRRSWGAETNQVHSIYDPQLRDLRHDIDQAIRDQALQELQLKRYEYDIWQIQQQITSFNIDQDREKMASVQNQLDRSIVELDQIKLQFDEKLKDLARQRETMEYFLSEVNNLKNELDSHQLERILLESEIQTLKEHAAFQDAIHQEQCAELQNLKTPTLDVTGFYRDELARAISEIRRDFEVLSQSRSAELEEYYQVKTEEIRNKIAEEEEKKRILAKSNALESTETANLIGSIKKTSDELKGLKDENQNLENLLDSLLADLETIENDRENQNFSYEKEFVQLENEIEQKRLLIGSILENNVSLQFEISTYRRLLESEENRLKKSEENQLKKSENQIQTKKTTDYSLSNVASAVPIRPLESGTKKMTVSKTARGPITIESVDFDTDSIVLINDKYSGNSQSFENWSLRRKNDEKDELIYSFPASFSLAPKESVRILSQNSPATSRLLNNVLSADQIQSWGKGQKMVTRLIDNNNEEKSLLTQTFQ